ncbi:MAG TPA: ubiquitin-like domain-containing protein [Candidatus Saccharimonadales bacterium]|nr:ubiquitin-like domain-containing protein [Candidatus Saccharimonadales bacterium]
MRRFSAIKPEFRKLFRIRSWKHPFAVPFITVMVLVCLTGSVYLVARQTNRLPPVHDAKVVIISHDKEQQIVPSKEPTVGALLAKLNIRLGQGDVVEPALNTPIEQDQFRINIYRAVPVAIVDGGQKTYTSSAAKTPRAIARQAGVQTYPEDRIIASPANNSYQSGIIGEQVTVERSVPINVDLYGTPVAMRTQAKTVGQLMKEKNIKLIQNDQISPAANTPITPGMQISFIRTGVKVETITEEIATPVQKINDPSLAYGTKAIRQQGSPGQQVVTYQIQIVNNVERGRTVIQKVVNKQPVTQIEVVGTSLSGIKGDMGRAGIAPGDYQYADYIISKESGWRPDARNPSGAYGLCQALPGSKMGSAGADWQTNPVTQLRWCNGYAVSRYGSWAAAYNHWLSAHSW